MADISQLSLQEPDELEWEKYEGPGEGKSFTPPPAGRYIAVAPSGEGAFAFATTQQGKLKAQFGPIKIVGGDHDGYEIRYFQASVAKYRNRNGSPLGDYLRSCGVLAQPKSNQEYADLVEATAGRQFPIDLDWEGYCKECATEINGYDSFPEDPNGGRVGSMKCPQCGKVIYARARIRRCVSTVA